MNIWRDRLDRWLSPLAAGSPLSPNAISVIALALILSASLCLALAGNRPILFLAALPLIALGGLLDAFDGIVARAQHRSSRLGDFLDHTFDRIADLSLVVGWTLGSGVRKEIALGTLMLVSLHGYLGTQLEASFGRRNYEGTGRGEFVLVLVILPILGWILSRLELLGTPYWHLTIAEWVTMLLAAGAMQGIISRLRSGVAISRESE